MERVVTTTLEIAKTPQEVFDFIADTDNWLKIDMLDVQPRGRLALGTEGWHLRKQGGSKARSTWRVSEFEPGRKLTMLARGGGMEIRDETRLEAIPTGSRATFTVTFAPTAFAMRLLLPLFMGWIRRNLREYYANIKTQVESAVWRADSNRRSPLDRAEPPLGYHRLLGAWHNGSARALGAIEGWALQASAVRA